MRRLGSQVAGADRFIADRFIIGEYVSRAGEGVSLAIHPPGQWHPGLSRRRPGYRWVGSAAQGVWFAVPDGWAAVDLSKVNVDQAISRFRLKGVNNSVMKSALNELSQRHALFAADLASAVRSPHEFATNANAVCSPTPVAPDASSLPALKAAARDQYAQIDAHVLTLRDATVDGNVGIRSEFTLTSTSGLSLTDTQYIVLTKSSHACTITLSSDNPRPFQQIFRKIGSTIRVS